MIRHLYDLAFEHLKVRYPSVPNHCMPQTKYTDKTANGLEKCICDFLNLSGHHAKRVKTQGRLLDNTKIVTDVLGGKKMIGSKKYIPGTGTVGASDVSGWITAISGKVIPWEIEVKMKDRQSKGQKEYQEKVEKSNGFYSIVHNFNEFYSIYSELMNK